MKDVKPGSNGNLIFNILKIIEEKPYCSLSSISLGNYDAEYILEHLTIIFKENLIFAEPAVNESGVIINLFNIRLTLKGLLFLKKLNSFPAGSGEVNLIN